MNLKQLDKEVTKLYEDLVNHEFIALQFGEIVHPDFRWSAINLLRYLVLRTHDLRKIHDSLSENGISSMRSGEGYVLRNVVDVLKLIKLLRGKEWNPDPNLQYVGYKRSRKLIRRHSQLLFNKQDRECKTEIMVTMPSEAAENEELIANLLQEGMEIARINLSHDSEERWLRMVQIIRAYSEALKLPCKILMDLSGPKIRTGKIDIKISGKKGKKNRLEAIELKEGDHLILKGKKSKSAGPEIGEDGIVLKPAIVPVNIPGIFQDIKTGDRVFFDDGKIESRVLRISKKEIEVVIQNCGKKALLKSEKGINLPDTELHIDSLTEEDRNNIPFVLKYADIVGYSFVRNASDVELLQKLIKKSKREVGILLKIENNEAFENLPMILMQAMKSPKLGVMIARGDLAVEVGPERMSEVQDQIMWICEAAHLPVVWATEVLDNLAKTGRPTRSEITDAALGVRAECVMLNKGPYILDAVRTLRRILIRMEDHSSKKKSQMRPLKLAIHALDKLKISTGFLPETISPLMQKMNLEEHDSKVAVDFIQADE